MSTPSRASDERAHAAQSGLGESRPDFQALFEAVPSNLVVFDRDYTIVAATDAYVATASRPRSEIVGRNVFETFPDNPDDPAADGVRKLRRSLDTVVQRRVANAMPRQKYDVQDPVTGLWEERYWEPLNVPVCDSNGEVVYIIQRVEEVTDSVLQARRAEHREQALRSTEKQLEAAQRMARLGSWEYHLADGSVTVSDGFRHLFGGVRATDGLYGLLETAHPDDRPLLRAKIDQSVAGRDAPDVEYRSRPNGERRIIQCRCAPVREAGVVATVRATIQDITAFKRLEEERAALLADVQLLARTDPLTGLANRRAWEEELPRELARAARQGTPLVVAVIDLDHFKHFNDTRGHQAGDMLLERAAAAWRATLRETDVLARYGGEEFALALPGCDESEAVLTVARVAAATPSAQTVSAGVATWDHAESAAHLFARADEALYAAKQAGRNTIRRAGLASSL